MKYLFSDDSSEKLLIKQQKMKPEQMVLKLTAEWLNNSLNGFPALTAERNSQFVVG